MWWVCVCSGGDGGGVYVGGDDVCSDGVVAAAVLYAAIL